MRLLISCDTKALYYFSGGALLNLPVRSGSGNPYNRRILPEPWRLVIYAQKIYRLIAPATRRQYSRYLINISFTILSTYTPKIYIYRKACEDHEYRCNCTDIPAMEEEEEERKRGVQVEFGFFIFLLIKLHSESEVTVESLGFE